MKTDKTNVKGCAFTIMHSPRHVTDTNSLLNERRRYIVVSYAIEVSAAVVFVASLSYCLS